MKTNFLNLVAKMPQNTGGGSSQSFTLRSIGAQRFTLRSIGAQRFTLRSIGAQYFTRFLGSSCRVWKYVACMLMVLVLSIGQMWGDTDYVLIDYSTNPSNPAKTANFINTTSLSAFSSSIKFTEADESTTTLSHYVAATNKTVSGQTANDGHFVYDLKTTSADVKIYVYNKNSNDKNVYVSLLSECEQVNETITAKTKKAQIITKSVTCTTGGTRIVISGNSSDVQFAQIIITEKGSAVKSFGEDGYTLDGKRVAVKDKSGSYDGAQIVSSSDVKYMNADICKPTVSSNVPSGYIKFTTPNNGKNVLLTIGHSSSKAVVVDELSELPATNAGYSQLATAVTETKAKLGPNKTYMIFSINSSPTINTLAFSIPKVTYNANGGSETMAATEWTVAANGFTAPSGKKFDKWTKNADGTGGDVAVGYETNENLTLYAQWKDDVPVYGVTYNLNGATGTTPTETDKEENEVFTLHNGVTGITAPDTKVFGGWNDGTSTYAGGAEYTMGKDPVEFTAQWVNTYAISYNKGANGTGDITGGSKAHGLAYTLSTERFTRAGYVQVGWALTDGGTKAYDLGGSYTANVAQEFFPVWAETSTYVAEFNSGDGCSASAPAGWTFANAGSYGAEVATADYECKFGENFPSTAAEVVKNANYIAFAKKSGACATYDLGNATTVSAVAGTFYVGSGSERTFTIEYLAADGTTVLHTISTTTSSNWGEKAVNDATIVSNVQYIRINPAHNGGSYSWLVMKAFSVTYVDLVTKYDVIFDKNNAGAGGKQATLKYAEGAEVTLPGCTFTAPDDMEFDAWISDDVTISNNKFTMPGKDVVIKATWKPLTENYTVIYKDGETELKRATVEVGHTPEAYTPTKDFYTFASWSTDPSTLGSTAANAEVVLTASWTPNYAFGAYSFVNTATVGTNPNKLTMTDGSAVNVAAGSRVDNFYFSAMAIKYESGASDALDDYKGWKINTKDATIKFLVEKNSQVKVAIGRDNTAAVSYTALNGTAMNNVNQEKSTEVAYSVKAGTIFTISMTTGNTITLKRITITPLYNATYTDGTGDASGSASNVTEVTLPTPSETTVGSYSFTGWVADKTVYDDEENAKTAGEALSAGGTYTLTATTTFTAQWQLISDFDVKFYQGYGEPDAQIGETQSISTGGHAVAPTDPTRTGFAFLGWSYDATEAHIVDVATYAITAATNFTAMWKAVWTVTFDGAGSVEVENGEKVASPDSPTQAGKVFQGWYNGESKYDFSAAVASNLALTSKWADADPNHYVYAYNDDFHFDGVVYKTPEGKVDAGNGNQTIDLDASVTLFSEEEGITSVVAANAQYDSKGNDTRGAAIQYVTAMLKLKNEATSKVTVTIKSGYTATLKIKSSGFSATRTINVSDATPASASTTGSAVGNETPYSNTNGELTFALTSGAHDITVTGGTLYISELDIEATAIPAKTVTYHANNGTSNQTVDDNATQIAACSFSYTGHKFIGWNENADGTGTAHAVGAVVGEDLELYAQWVEVFAVTFNLNGQSGSIAAQSVEKNGTATKPADPVVIGQEFGGWYTSSACADGDEFDFNTAITEAKELFAKWTAFDGCVMLYPATSGDSPANEGDEIAMQTGSEGATMTVNTLSSGELNYTASGLQFAKSGSPKVNVTLNSNTLKAGSVISMTLIAQGTTNPRGLYLNTAAGVRINAFTCWVANTNPATNGAEETFTYTVVADDGLDGTNAFQLERNNTVLLKKLTIKNCGAEPVTVTFKKADDTQIAEKVIEKGSYVTAPAAPRICGSRLTGWSETVDGELVDLATTAINADKTFYPVYAVNTPVVSGTVYKFQLKTDLTSGNMFATAPLPATAITTENFLSELVGGELEASNTNNNNNRIVINDKKAIGFSGGDGGKLTLYLNEPLKVGDEIRFINYASSGNSITLSDGTNNTTLNGNGSETVQTFSVPAAWEATGSCVLTMVRGSNTAKLTYFEIYRRPVLTGVSLNELTVRVNAVANPEMTLTPSNDAIVTNQAWSIVSGSDKITIDATGAVTGVAAGDAVIKVVLNEDEENFSATATVHVVNDYARQDVTGSMEWNWANSGPLSGVAAHENNNVSETLLANIGTMPNNAEFRSDMLVTTCQHAYRKNTGNGCWQGTEIKFYTTVPGAVKVNYMGKGNDEAVTVSINNWSNTYTGSWTDSKTVVVPAGWVTISASESDKLRIKTITFTAAADLNPAKALDEAYYYGGYEREVNPQYYGTICLPKAGVIAGATLFELAYMDYKEDGVTPYKVYYDEVLNGELEAGMPYIFLAQQSIIGVFYTNTAEETAKDKNGLHGTLEDITSGMNGENKYMLYNNQVLHSTSPASMLPANRAYIQLNEVEGYNNPNYHAAPAKPGRRRISTGFNAPQIATGLEDAAANEKPVKVLINGELYILRGEKMYDATGRLVK